MANWTPGPWADGKLARSRYDRNNAEIDRYVEIEKRVAGELRSLVTGQVSGQLTPDQAIREADRVMRQGQADAFASGRRARGVASATISPQEVAMLEGQHRNQMEYWRGFVGDVEKGRGRMDYHTRAEMYAESLWSVYSRGETIDWDQAEPLDPDYEYRFFWVLDPDVEHCDTCRERQKMSILQNGFTWAELVELGFPGERTKCGVRCRCHIRRVKVRRKVPKDAPEPVDEPQRGGSPSKAPSPAAEDVQSAFESLMQPAVARTPSEGLDAIESATGGATMPVPLPAAGLAGVQVSPSVLRDQLANSTHPDDLGRLLPFLPLLLVKPEQVKTGQSVRQFDGHGLSAEVSRDEDGRWHLLSLALSPELLALLRSLDEV